MVSKIYVSLMEVSVLKQNARCKIFHRLFHMETAWEFIVNCAFCLIGSTDFVHLFCFVKRED